MRAMVVYESMYGNTRKVAHALAAGLARYMSVDLDEVASAPATLPIDLDLLLVGGPTHRFGLSRVRSRADAVAWAHKDGTDGNGGRDAQSEPDGRAGHAEASQQVAPATRYGLRDWLKGHPSRQRRVLSVAFGTQLDRPRWLARFGTAADAIEHCLLRMGMPLAAPAQQFYVTGMSGPLLAGEEDRATAWAASLAAEITGRSSEVLQRLAREHEKVLATQRGDRN
jgi:hypothetical protein